MKQWNEEERWLLYSQIQTNHGKEKQVVKAIEELNELSVAICKWLGMNGANHNRQQLVDEMADVLIMIEQLERLLGAKEEVHFRAKQKLERQLERENGGR